MNVICSKPKLVVYMCGSFMGCPGRDLATVEQRGFQPRLSHEVLRLKLVGPSTVAMMDD
jgi:hypothetical protein